MFVLSCHGIWPTYQCHAYEEIWFFLPFQPSTVQSSSTKSGSLCAPPPPMVDLPNNLILPGSYASKGIYCEFMHAEDSVSPRSSWLATLTIFLPLPWCSLSIEWGRDCDINVTFRAESFADTLHFDQWWLSVLTSVYQTKTLPWWGLRATLACGYRGTLFRRHLDTMSI